MPRSIRNRLLVPPLDGDRSRFSSRESCGFPRRSVYRIIYLFGHASRSSRFSILPPRLYTVLQILESSIRYRVLKTYDHTRYIVSPCHRGLSSPYPIGTSPIFTKALPSMIYSPREILGPGEMPVQWHIMKVFNYVNYCRKLVKVVQHLGEWKSILPGIICPSRSSPPQVELQLCCIESPLSTPLILGLIPWEHISLI